jgi:hypothetical protein
VELMKDSSSPEYIDFDALMNSRWQRIFAKVEFVVFVSNIVYVLGYVWSLSCIRCDR